MVRAVVRPPRGRWWPLVLVLALGWGCGLAQRPSVKMVDPTLVAEGTALERSRMRGELGAFGLGPYVVREVAVRTEPPDPDGPLAREDVRWPVTQHRARLRLEARQAGRSWTTVCVLQRRAPAQADFRAVLDENGDEVSVECTATSGGRPWRFTARTLLSTNFVGSLGPEGDDPWRVEVLTRAIHFKRLERVLPVPVAQLRLDGRAAVAMLLGRPERAWVAQGVDPVTTEATLALMTALSLLPWELAE